MSGRRCESRRAFLVASHGGHWVQLRRLAPAFEGMDVWYVTTTAKVREEVAPAPVDEAVIDDTARRIAERRASVEGREGLSAFLEKRRPKWCEG